VGSGPRGLGGHRGLGAVPILRFPIQRKRHSGTASTEFKTKETLQNRLTPFPSKPKLAPNDPTPLARRTEIRLGVMFGPLA
jgi:hypothetical protein